MSAQGALPDGPADFGLIETLLWTPSDGFWLVEGHFARMAASATALGIAFAPEGFAAALAQASAGAQTEALRVRLVLKRGGGFEVSATSFRADPPEKIWRVAVALTKRDSRDAMLRHKTTRRAHYEDALAACGADEVIFLNERGEVCEGARTNLFVERGGVLLTPPVSSGLLPGVFRAKLLEERRAREAVLRLADLDGRFFIGNALRGLLPSQLASSASGFPRPAS